MPWGIYRNGNSICRINLDNGTKIRETMDDEFDLEFPESLDLNIGNRCDGGCPMCYINASTDGIDADLMNIKFIDSLHPYTEVAINGNSVDHPQLISFLKKLKERKLIPNLTVNQIHFERKEDLISMLIENKLIYGLGISLRKATPEFVKRVKKYPNAVIHTINGILTPEDIEILRDNNLKILILGYKNLGRGINYKEDNEIALRRKQKYLYDILPTLANHFCALSFDNLAISQLKPQRFLSPEKWEEIYMGDEGSASMFVDLVSGKFGVSSLCNESEMHPIMDDIKDMFAQVKKDALIA